MMGTDPLCQVLHIPLLEAEETPEKMEGDLDVFEPAA